jgi:hypothetical protein
MTAEIMLRALCRNRGAGQRQAWQHAKTPAPVRHSENNTWVHLYCVIIQIYYLRSIETVPSFLLET